jgi:hypothetical protein
MIFARTAVSSHNPTWTPHETDPRSLKFVSLLFGRFWILAGEVQGWLP